jgi:anhydro-N-acetylmuramic acid kinase
VIGLMSGTSADGVDAALLFTDGQTLVEAGAGLFVPYDDTLRADILALMRGVGDEADIARRLTDVHIVAVRQLVEKTNITPQLVGLHGQTIRHAPAEGITVQIGDGQRMARELGIPVVADFRSNDVAHGGQGAPLVPLYHAALTHALPKPLMVVNIGGVSNVTWIGEESTVVPPPLGGRLGGGRDETQHLPITAPPQPSPYGGGGEFAASACVNTDMECAASIIAFDSGPGNALMDDWVFRHTGKRYDANGAIAARGVADSVVVSEFLRDPFFLADVPKSLDRNQFDGVLARLAHLSLEDGAATLATITAAAIALSFGAVPANPGQVLICGGGRHNAHLMGLLKACVNAPVLPVEAVGWDGDMLEAQAFAYLAARSVQGLPLSVPRTTGVKEAVTGGVLYSVGGGW